MDLILPGGGRGREGGNIGRRREEGEREETREEEAGGREGGRRKGRREERKGEGGEMGEGKVEDA